MQATAAEVLQAVARGTMARRRVARERARAAQKPRSALQKKSRARPLPARHLESELSSILASCITAARQAPIRP